MDNEKKSTYVTVKEVCSKAEERLSKPITNRDELVEALGVLFTVQHKINQVRDTIEKLTFLSSELNRVTAEWAIANHDKINLPFTEVKEGIRQLFIGDYILTESKGEVDGKERIYRLWGRLIKAE